MHCWQNERGLLRATAVTWGAGEGGVGTYTELESANKVNSREKKTKLHTRKKSNPRKKDAPQKQMSHPSSSPPSPFFHPPPPPPKNNNNKNNSNKAPATDNSWEHQIIATCLLWHSWFIYKPGQAMKLPILVSGDQLLSAALI